MTKFSFKSLALCAAMLSFGFADNTDVFGGELGGKIEQTADPNERFQEFITTYDRDEFIEKANICKDIVQLKDIQITSINCEYFLDRAEVANYEANVNLGLKLEGKIYLSAKDPDFLSICFENLKLDGIEHELIFKMVDKNEFLIEIFNDKGSKETKKTLSSALEYLGGNVPMLSKALICLRNNWQSFQYHSSSLLKTFDYKMDEIPQLF